ncbi:MAG: class I cytochrome c [Rhodocyclales bacterium GT-UBC]|nr:MAG: class I cytochrome c [Rhodocyclales bacterium GT-UBC]
MNTRFSRTVLFSSLFALFMGASSAYALDDDEAKALLKKNNCLKCHALDKKKDGPSYKEIADKQRGKPDAEAKIYKHVTTFNKVKIKDKEEDHEPLKTKDEAEIKGLVQWILSR